VAKGSWSAMKPGDYRDLIEIYQRTIDEAKEPKLPPGKGEEKAATVEVVETVAEVERRIRERGDIHAVVFVSRGMKREAEKFATTYPSVRTIVFTGLVPEGKVIWIDKNWATNSKVIQDIILN